MFVPLSRSVRKPLTGTVTRVYTDEMQFASFVLRHVSETNISRTV